MVVRKYEADLQTFFSLSTMQFDGRIWFRFTLYSEPYFGVRGVSVGVGVGVLEFLKRSKQKLNHAQETREL